MSIKKNICLESIDKDSNINIKNLEKELDSIWKFIECNFDKTVEKIVITEKEAQIFISYELDDSQKERLFDNFNIISGVDSYKDYLLIDLDI